MNEYIQFEMQTGQRTILATLKKQRYHKDNFLIAEMECDEEDVQKFSAKGNMLTPEIGMSYELTGDLQVDQKWGPVLSFENYKTVYPTDLEAIELYLRENLKFVGKAIAKRITDAFGEDTLNICKTDSARVAREVKGISEVRAGEIADLLLGKEALEHAEIEIRKLFHGLGVPRTTIQKLIAQHESEIVEKIRANPYFLTAYSGISFPRAD